MGGKASAGNGERAAAQRIGVERLRRLGYEIPREPPTGKRGVSPYAAAVRLAIGNGWMGEDGGLLVGTPDAIVKKPDEVLESQTALQALGKIDLASATGRLRFRTVVAELLALGTIDARTSDALGALAKAQAKDVTAEERKTRPRVRFVVPQDRVEAQQTLREAEEREAAS